MHLFSIVPLVALIVAAGVGDGFGQVAAGESTDQKAIREAGKAYLAALARGDGQALAAAWTAGGDYIDAAGQTLKARDLIREQFPTTAGQPKATSSGDATPAPKSAMAQSTPTVSSIRMIKPDVAIQDGTLETPSAAGRPPTKLRFTVVWVKQDGRWLLDALREASAPPPGGETLDELQWLVGDWIAQQKANTLSLSCGWTPDQKFLLAEFTVRNGDDVILSGTQRIAWDPLTHRVKSWSFDSQGGFGEGDWTGSGGDWTVRTSHVLPDGTKTTATNTYHRDGDNSFTWKSTESRVEGLTMPENGVQFKRQAASKP